MKVKLLEDFDYKGNDSEYSKDQIINVVELDVDLFPTNYVRYYENENGWTIDWIPKNICEPIK